MAGGAVANGISVARCLLLTLIVAPLASIVASVIMSIWLMFDSGGSADAGQSVAGVAVISFFATIISAVVVFGVMLILVVPLTLLLQRLVQSDAMRHVLLAAVALVIGIAAILMSGESVQAMGFGSIVCLYSVVTAAFWIAALRIAARRTARTPAHVEEAFR